MTSGENSALDVAMAYYRAWTSKDIDAAMAFVHDDIVCDAPTGPINGAHAYRQFLGPFTQILLAADLLAAFGDDTKAVLVYGTRTVPVPSAPGAECLTVVDGKITHSTFIFDRLPFSQARAAD